MRRAIAGIVSALAIATLAAQAVAASPPATWDNLVKTPSKRAAALYLLPGEDFCIYKKVKLDPPEVAFRKNWQRDLNSSITGLSGKVSDEDARRIMEAARSGFADILTKAYQDAGYQVVDTEAFDVLRVRTGIINLAVDAPDIPTAGRSRTFSRQAGSATLVVEARDSMTGALLGRAVDSRAAGDSAPYERNRVTNTADFSRLFTRWAKASADGLNVLKSRSTTCSMPGGAPKT